MKMKFIYLSFDNTGLHNEMLHRKLFLCWNTEDELWRLTAWGEKLLCSLVVGQRILLYLPDGNRVNRLLLRWVLSFNILVCEWMQTDAKGYPELILRLHDSNSYCTFTEKKNKRSGVWGKQQKELEFLGSFEIRCWAVTQLSQAVWGK